MVVKLCGDWAEGREAGEMKEGLMRGIDKTCGLSRNFALGLMCGHRPRFSSQLLLEASLADWSRRTVSSA